MFNIFIKNRRAKWKRERKNYRTSSILSDNSSLQSTASGMSSSSVFGMNHDFNFDQTAYTENNLNSVENRQNDNNPKAVDQVNTD